MKKSLRKELRDRRIGIITRNFSIYYKMHTILSEMGILTYHGLPGEPIPSDVVVVLTTEDEETLVKHPIKVVVRDDLSIEKYADLAVALLDLKKLPEHIVIGIDPGEHPGFVVMSNGRIIHAKNLESPEDVGQEVKSIITAYSPRTCVIKIGNLGGVYFYRILRSLLGINARVEIVDEYFTSLKVRKFSDILAAIRIAMRSGKAINVRDEIKKMKIPEGFVREIQRRSRLKSNGRVTISKDLALKVALGEISLEEAIERMMSKSRRC